MTGRLPTVRRASALAAGFVVLALSAVGGAASAPPAAAATAGPAAVRRMLVVSLPMVTWADLPLDQMPHLRGLLEQSIVADLSVRGVDPKPTLGDAYVTIAAGTRSKGGPGDGQAVERPDGSVLARSFAAIVRHNSHLLFNADPGALGAALRHAHIGRAVIGNADEAVPTGPSGYARQVANSLATPDGVTPTGAVGSGLTVRDASGPFGLAINPAAYLDAFRRAWQGRTVVMVEDSDLVRFDATAVSRTAGREPALHQLLVRFDGLLGNLLAAVDPQRDAVMVVGPTDPRGAAQLTVASLRAPGMQPGFAISDFTRRSGFVSIVDVGPTILDQFHITAPDSMEGRPMEPGRTGGTFAERQSFLVDANRAARFRDARIGPVTVAFILAQVLLTLGAAIAFTWFGRRSRRAIELGALTLLGFLPATFLAGLVPFDRHPAALYWLFVVGVGAVIGVGAYLVCDRRGVGPLLICLGVIVGLLVVDVVTGARLQFNTVFGYSPTVGGRFAGIGNLAYSQLSAAALLFACLLAFRIGGRKGAVVATTVLAIAIVVDGNPIWGSDIGGVLSMVPAYAIAVMGLFALRVRVRSILIGIGLTALALLVFTLVDLSRPVAHQTHLARLVTSTHSGGWHSFSIVVRRKLSENFGVLFSSFFTLMVPVALGGVAYVIYRAPGRLRALHERIPTMRWALVSLGVLAVLGFALNDSGISIPGVMMGVLAPVLIVIVIRADRDQVVA